MSAKSKQLSPAFLYDERGSNLFEDICKLDEYYLTRSEAEILESKSAAIVEPFDKDTVVVVSSRLKISITMINPIQNHAMSTLSDINFLPNL